MYLFEEGQNSFRILTLLERAKNSFRIHDFMDCIKIGWEDCGDCRKVIRCLAIRTMVAGGML